uniref:Uncharacterized protein n=1 Tax=Euplotes harpa TaxID=151035 RepID=A0A7S3N6S7_9SPIT|mmetsp:Transcript_17888/g.20663  ORF Transcript_17888/g.20663 Transcript_17888/m.20663 type:complete len:126 (+) Transcript_17888:143-520(+)
MKYMHIKQHKMSDRYVNQLATVYVFYNRYPLDDESMAKVEGLRSDLNKFIEDLAKYIDLEEVVIEDSGYDDLLTTYNTSSRDLKTTPFIMVNEFDERVWIYNINMIPKIKERLKTVISEGLIYFK